ncbi:FMRFamide receptor-like [Haliotis rufescens]|uniref:FMRFamide receptor-like n=1 Tax=Haliotis rufescens TaxID=6454 RepID=UPI00201F1609|nr:FMRFamide receptor-like [Haliotis rufescens]
MIPTSARARTDMTTATIYNVTDIDAGDSIANNKRMKGNLNNTVNNEVMQSNSASPFALIHSGSVTETTYNSFNTVLQIIQFPLNVIALAINLCNVVVFSQRRMKSATSTILLALCISEFLHLTTIIFASTMKFIYGGEVVSIRFYLIYGLYVNLYATVSLRRVGFCYNCLVSAERFIAVTFPLQAKSMRLVKNPGVVCALIMVASFVGHIFSPMKYIVISYSASDNTTAYRLDSSLMYVKDKVHFANCSLASQFIFVYFMLFGCLVFNLLIVISIQRHSKGRQSMKTSQSTGDAKKREMQTTITIMVSTVVVVILALPANTNAFISNFNDDYGINVRQHFLFLLVARVGIFCELVSYFTNFFFYIALSASFRETFIRVFIPCATTGKSAKSTVIRKWQPRHQSDRHLTSQFNNGQYWHTFNQRGSGNKFL